MDISQIILALLLSVSVNVVKVQIVTPIPTTTPTLIPTNTPTPTLPLPTPILRQAQDSGASQPNFSAEQIYNLIERYASEYHVDPNVLRYMARCESGFDPKARNYIYAGLFQYNSATWKSFRKMMGLNTDPNLRYNAEEAIRTTAYLLSQNRAYLWPNCIPK